VERGFVLWWPLLFIAGKVFCDEGMAVQVCVMLESMDFSFEILATLLFYFSDGEV